MGGIVNICRNVSVCSVRTDTFFVTVHAQCHDARACFKIAFWQMCVTICGRFVPNEGGVGGKGIKGNALRRLNVVQISRKVGRIDGGNEF